MSFNDMFKVPHKYPRHRDKGIQNLCHLRFILYSITQLYASVSVLGRQKGSEGYYLVLEQAEGAVLVLIRLKGRC